MGCQMNKSDSERMFGMLSHLGYEQTQNAKDANLVMVNTCSIRQLSEDKAFSLIGVWGQWKKTVKPDLKIGFCGCVAQQKMKEVFRRAPYVDFVLNKQTPQRKSMAFYNGMSMDEYLHVQTMNDAFRHRFY